MVCEACHCLLIMSLMTVTITCYHQTISDTPFVTRPVVFKPQLVCGCWHILNYIFYFTIIQSSLWRTSLEHFLSSEKSCAMISKTVEVLWTVIQRKRTQTTFTPTLTEDKMAESHVVTHCVNQSSSLIFHA